MNLITRFLDWFEDVICTDAWLLFESVVLTVVAAWALSVAVVVTLLLVAILALGVFWLWGPAP